MSFNPCVLFLPFATPLVESSVLLLGRAAMGLTMRSILLLFFVSFVFILFNFEILEGALHLAGHDRKVDAAAAAAVTTHGAGFDVLPRFRMLFSLHHQQSPHRRHQRNSAAPAPSPVPSHEARSSGPGSLLHPHKKKTASAARSSGPGPLLHPHKKKTSSAYGSHTVPARSAVRRLGNGGHAKIPKAAIVALAVVGACLLVLGVAIATVSLMRLRRFQKGDSKPFKLFCYGSRAQRSPSATRKVSSHPSPDQLYLSSVVQCQHNHLSFKQSFESRSLSILSSSPKSTEVMISDHPVKNHNCLMSEEVESFHSVPCSHSSTGSINNLPLQICDRTSDPSPSSPHTDNSSSTCSYRSLSPDHICRLPPKSPPFTDSSHFSLLNTPHHPTQESDAQKTHLSCEVRGKANNISRPAEHHEVPKEEQINSKSRNTLSESNSPSDHMDNSLHRTIIASGMPNTKLDSNTLSNTTDGAKLQIPSPITVRKSPPLPPKYHPPSSKRQNSGQPPLPPALPLQIQVGEDGCPLPRLKPLHWDKVRAAPNRSMVWNDIRSSSFEFEFDEQMIKSLFAYNFHGLAKDEDATSKTLHTTKHVIEHHRLQNTTILLKTLNATTEQVYSSIAQGTGLSVQQLEALVKMKPTKEEEEKLLNCDGGLDMLDPAENFVKALLSIPMAFTRMEVMLYKETFNDEVVHIKTSFHTIEEACTELRSSKLLLRLLEAVLKTGNRMNTGTLRGGASAFRLETLLKLADIRGADGKTTLLHFLVQEMARSKGSKVPEKMNETRKRSCHTKPTESEECWAIGTEFVSELSNELVNVKKVASIDLDTLISSISNLSCGLVQLRNLVKKDLPSNEKNDSFLQCMESFLNYAENTMQELQVGKAHTLHHVRELSEYYHGEVGKDESDLLHIFVIIKDFLGLLNRVCREMRGSKYNQPLNLVLPLR